MAPLSESLLLADADEQFLKADLAEMDRLNSRILTKKQIYRKVQPIIWRNVTKFILLHIAALFGLYLAIFQAKWSTLLWVFFVYCISQIGVTAGAHRLWSHRSFKATNTAKIIFMLCDTLSFQNDVIQWSRDHRCHHKWTDTDADPHNSRRGLFYSHIGWLMVKKHPEVIRKGKTLDISDLTGDPILAFQRKYYMPLVLIITFGIPTLVPYLLLNESYICSLYVASLLRYVFTLNSTFLINSVAHAFGYKPYDKNISPVENPWTSALTLGEGGHNYHHTFPQDYRTSEFGVGLNWTKVCIDIFASLGWVYDRKVTQSDVIERKKAKNQQKNQ